MSESTAARVVEALSFGQKTEKRVQWESWSLKIVDPRKVEVTNESYGFKRDEHKYVVSVEERDGLFVPTGCECPADEYSDDYACKHRVAVAVVGGPVVLGAAMAFTSRDETPLRADGGVVEASGDESGEEEECDCSEVSGFDFPCWPCYQNGKWK